MSPKLIVGVAALLLFTVGAVAGSKSAPRIPRAAPRAAPSPEVRIQESPIASEKKPEVEKRPETQTGTEETGVKARSRYLEELAAGRLDSESLWIVFRSGGRGLSQFLLERLSEGVADPKERLAIYTEIDRFTLPSSKSVGLTIDDSVLTMAQAKSLHADPLERAIAARLLGTRDEDLFRNTLWRMTEGETDNEAQMAIAEALAPIASPTIEAMNRFSEVTKVFWGKEQRSPRGGKLDRLIAAQRVLTKRCEEEYLRQNPSLRR